MAHPLRCEEPIRYILPALPFPPSSNGAYARIPRFKRGACPGSIRNVHDLNKYVYCHTILTREGEQYKQTIAQMLNQSGHTTELRDFIHEHVLVDMILYAHSPRWLTQAGTPSKMDDDNRIKILKDAIFATIGIDDCYTFFSGVRKVPAENECVVVVFSKTPEVIDEF